MPVAASVAALVVLTAFSLDAPLLDEIGPVPVVEPGIADASTPLIARKVAWCESRFDGQAKNPNSSASGYFQFIDSTWESVTGLRAPARDYPYSVQLDAWETLWDGGRGSHHWSPSEHCWTRERPWD